MYAERYRGENFQMAGDEVGLEDEEEEDEVSRDAAEALRVITE